MAIPPIPPFVPLVGKIRRTFVATKIQAFTYDFTRDGGALGSYGTGIFIPNAISILTRITYRIIASVTGGMGSNIQIGWAGGLSLIDQQPTPITANLTSGLLNNVVSPVGFEILFTIDTAALTAGKVVIALEYIDEPVN